MKNPEIFKLALERAKKHGYKPINCEVTDMYENFGDYDYCVFSNIFNHDFAKAFWGEEAEDCMYFDTAGNVYINKDAVPEGVAVRPVTVAWQKHLEIMVRKKEPLKYIEKFL